MWNESIRQLKANFQPRANLICFVLFTEQRIDQSVLNR